MLHVGLRSLNDTLISAWWAKQSCLKHRLFIQTVHEKYIIYIYIYYTYIYIYIFNLYYSYIYINNYFVFTVSHGWTRLALKVILHESPEHQQGLPM